MRMTTADRLQAVQERIQEALVQSGRSEGSARLVAVTKNQTIASIQELYSLGLREMAESRVMEGLEKIECLPNDISWHLIGTLQQNKVSKVIGRFSCIHSVDSISLARKLSAKGQEAGLKIPAFIQVNPLQEPTKHGFSCEELQTKIEEIAALPSLSIQGLMTMAPRREYGEKAVHQSFCQILELFNTLRFNAFKGSADFKELSMGMSQDFEIAIRYGATIVRVGSLLF
jgi:PLP dependent protein